MPARPAHCSSCTEPCPVNGQEGAALVRPPTPSHGPATVSLPSANVGSQWHFLGSCPLKGPRGLLALRHGACPLAPTLVPVPSLTPQHPQTAHPTEAWGRESTGPGVCSGRDRQSDNTPSPASHLSLPGCCSGGAGAGWAPRLEAGSTGGEKACPEGGCHYARGCSRHHPQHGPPLLKSLSGTQNTTRSFSPCWSMLGWGCVPAPATPAGLGAALCRELPRAHRASVSSSGQGDPSWGLARGRCVACCCLPDTLSPRAQGEAAVVLTVEADCRPT